MAKKQITTKSPRALREAWLMKVAAMAERQFKKLGYELPPYRVSIGFTSKGSKGSRIGECWGDVHSAGRVHEIFIVPTLDGSKPVAEVLVHEMVHAAVGLQAKHGRIFKKCANALGLEGKMKATYGGERFWEWMTPLLQKAGDIPHFQLTGGMSSSGPKKGNYHIKCECGECGYIVRTTVRWLDVATPVCPNPDCAGHGEPMVVQGA